MASTLDKLKAQHPSLYIPTAQSDGLADDNNTVSDDIKPFSEVTAATPMDISRLVSHLTNAVATAREEVSTLLQDLQPLKEKVITLKDECDEKKKVLCRVAGSRFTFHSRSSLMLLWFLFLLILVTCVDRRILFVN